MVKFSLLSFNAVAQPRFDNSKSFQYNLKENIKYFYISKIIFTFIFQSMYFLLNSRKITKRMFQKIIARLCIQYTCIMLGLLSTDIMLGLLPTFSMKVPWLGPAWPINSHLLIQEARENIVQIGCSLISSCHHRNHGVYMSTSAFIINLDICGCFCHSNNDCTYSIDLFCTANFGTTVVIAFIYQRMNSLDCKFID